MPDRASPHNMQNTTPAPTRPARPAKAHLRHPRAAIWTRILLILMALATLVAAYGGWKLWQWQSVPEVYTRTQAQLQAIPQDQRREMAESVERLATQAFGGWSIDPQSRRVDRQGDDGQPLPLPDHQPRTITLTTTEANAWLAERFDAWRANQQWALPASLSQFRIAIDDDQLHLMFRYHSPKLDQVFTLAGRLQVESDGQARLLVDRVLGGTMTLPPDMIVNQLRKAANDRNQKAIDTFVQLLEGQPFSPVWRADERRRFQLLDVKLEDDAVTVTYQMLPQTDASS